MTGDDGSHTFQESLVKKMGELGLFRCPIPEEYGGSELGSLAHAIVTEEISKTGGRLEGAL